MGKKVVSVSLAIKYREMLKESGSTRILDSAFRVKWIDFNFLAQFFEDYMIV